MSADPARLIPTASQTVGPFFDFGLAPDATLGCLVTGPATRGERIRLRVRVLDGDGVPVPDALIEIHQANADGAYTRHGASAIEFRGFGRLATDPDGACAFDTIRPGRVPDGRGGRQAAHINVCIFARGLLRHLYTRIYFGGDPALSEDPMLTLVPTERRPTLMAAPVPEEPGVWTFEIKLQGGEDETVFFEL
jgi:protocatechuate 3,4-dioxygenase alpha subunit